MGIINPNAFNMEAANAAPTEALDICHLCDWLLVSLSPAIFPFFYNSGRADCPS